MKIERKAGRMAIRAAQLWTSLAMAQQAFAVGTVALTVNGSAGPLTVPGGTPVTLQATISAPAAAYRVYFYEDGTQLSSCSQFPTATVTCTLANVPAGQHVFTNTTVYMNNANLGPAVGGTTNVASNAVTATVSGANLAVLPKYQILNITYAPPGPNSSVSYQTAGTVTTTLSDTASYQNSNSKTVSLSVTAGVPNYVSGTVTTTNTSGSSQTTTTQNQISIGVSATTLGKTSGPALTPAGVTPAVTVNTTIDHDYDSVTLWLNPVALYYVGPGQGTATAVTLLGFASDSSDTNVVGMDTATVLMGYLNGHFPMPAGLATQLARGWANKGQTPPADGVGLTAADFAQILKADPYMDSTYPFNYANGYGGTRTSPDGRYTLVSTSAGNPSSFSYGDNITTNTLTFAYTNVSTATSTASNQQTVGYGLSLSLQVGSAANNFKATLANSNTQTWTHTTSSSVTTSTVITNALTLAPPCTQPGCYTSYPTIEVFQDNLYGTFMFFPTY
jgi:hypothetical protein